ncbi:unnamed protein product [Amoebophrya sp. A120]|nr:unnamed protein product [Amoebophrya sp. A120]|eukprot:GSA120T00021890001.1
MSRTLLTGAAAPVSSLAQQRQRNVEAEPRTGANDGTSFTTTGKTKTASKSGGLTFFNIFLLHFVLKSFFLPPTNPGRTAGAVVGKSASSRAVDDSTSNPSAYRSTDFEVHRNWLAITGNLPLSQWYHEEKYSEWTLDYPPMFAYFEFFLYLVLSCGNGIFGGSIGRNKVLGDFLFDFEKAVASVRHSVNFASTKFIFFHRLSVILSDTVLVYAVWKWVTKGTTGGSRGSTTTTRGANRNTSHGHLLLPSLIFVVFNAGLLVVDHMHFQYNGMMYGILLLSAFELYEKKHLKAALLFTLLFNMKHIFLYCAPVYFVVLLYRECFVGGEKDSSSKMLKGDNSSVVPATTTTSKSTSRFSFFRFLRLGLLVLVTTFLIWAPVTVYPAIEESLGGRRGGGVLSFTSSLDLKTVFVATVAEVKQILSRLFPFGRGLTHAYWAPNVWALYNFADRVLAKVLKRSSSSGTSSSTTGLVETYSSVVLPTITPMVCLLLVVSLYFVLGLVLKRKYTTTTRSTNISSKEGDSAPASGSDKATSTKQTTLIKQTKSVHGTDFLFFLSMGSAVAFLVGWHVHEKAILMVTIPLQLFVHLRLPTRSRTSTSTSVSSNADFLRAFLLLHITATLSIMPLVPNTSHPLNCLAKYFLAAGVHLFEIAYLHERIPMVLASSRAAPAGRTTSSSSFLFVFQTSDNFLLTGVVATALYNEFSTGFGPNGLNALLFGERYSFVPLMLMSVWDAGVVLVCLARILRAF